MPSMKLVSVLLCVLGVSKFAYSQDTIQFINKASQAVKVIEIGISEIKYQRFDNLSGPLYVANKNEIRYIKFANGHVDSVTVATAIKPITSEPLTVYRSPISSADNEKIMIYGNRLSYHGNGVGESRLYRLISTVPNPEKKAALYKEYLVMKSYKKKQYLFGFVGLGAGLVLPYIGIMSSFIFEDATPLVIGLAAGATLGITGAVLSGINKSKRMKKRIDIVNLYNN